MDPNNSNLIQIHGSQFGRMTRIRRDHRLILVLKQLAHTLNDLPDDLVVLVDAVPDLVQVLPVQHQHVLVTRRQCVQIGFRFIDAIHRVRPGKTNKQNHV